MGLEIFEKAASTNRILPSDIVDLLHDAGFTDVALDGTITNGFQKFTSPSGVYGCNNFSIEVYSDSVVFTRYKAIKDESQKSLIVFPDVAHTSTDSTDAPSREFSFFLLLFVDGTFVFGSRRNTFNYCGMTGGLIKTATDTSEAKLVPFMDSNGDTHEPFYVAMNRVNHTINTVVTDGTNSFTSLGNLFYIKNA